MMFSVSDRQQRHAATQQIRQGPLDKEWDWEHTITTGGYNPPCINPLPLTFFQLFHLLFVSVVSVPLMALPHLCVFFLHSLSPSLPSHNISHSIFSLFPFPSLRLQLHDVETGNKGTEELKAHFSFWLCYIFSLHFLILCILNRLAWRSCRPERDEGAEQHKKLGLWTRHALLLAYIDTHTHTHAHTHTHTYILVTKC